MVQGIPGAVMQSRQTRLINDLTTLEDEIPLVADPAMRDGSLTTILSVPLQAYGQVLGALTFGTSKQGGYDRDDVKVAVSIAAHLALAIDRWEIDETPSEDESRHIRQASSSLTLVIALQFGHEPHGIRHHRCPVLRNMIDTVAHERLVVDRPAESIHHGAW